MIIPLTKKQRDAILASAGLAITEHVDETYGHEVWVKDGKYYIPPSKIEDISREGYCPTLLQLFLVKQGLIEGQSAETKSRGSVSYALSE